jgi:hypothetical protein
MATTTNYGWTTPDDTALVKDGAAAIRSLGTSVDTTTKNLNPETTLGDLAYRSSTANVKTRLGLGTAGQVLQVNSGATAPEWATVASGGMTLISTTTLSGATVSLSSIPQTYKSLRVVVYGVLGQTSDAQIWCKVNNTTTGMYVSGVRAGSASQLQDLRVYLTVGDASNRTSSDNAWVFQFDNYASTTNYKPMVLFGRSLLTDASIEQINYAGAFSSNSAITSLVFQYGGTNNFNGGTVELYGVK